MGTAAEEVALEKRAQELGIDLSTISKDSSSERISDALTELEAKGAVTPEYIDHVKEITDATGAILTKLAAATGSSAAKNLVSNYQSQIGGIVSGYADKILKNKFGEGFGDVCDMTAGLIDKGLDLAGFSHDEDDKQREEMRKVLLIMIAIIAAMFLSSYGISPQTIAIASQVFKYINENKSKSTYDIAKEASERIVSDKDLRHRIGDAAITGLETLDPSMKTLGLREKALAVEGAIASPETLILVEKSKALISTMGLIVKSPELIKAEVVDGLDTVLSRTLEDNPEVYQKFSKLLKETADKNLSGALKAALEVAKSGADSRNFIDKAKAFVGTISSVGSFIDNFKKLASDELQLTNSEKILLDRASKEMKQYVYERYGKHVEQFCGAADSLGAKVFSSKIGATRDVLRSFVDAISKLNMRDQHMSR